MSRTLHAFSANTQDMAIHLEDQLSENQGVTPEGYLICKNVPVSRVGVQYYLGSELGLNDKYNKRIPVYRLAEDVFNETALQSLESKPITDDHPTQSVTAQNASYLAMGHGRNVRHTDKHVMADLVLTNPSLIQAVREKRKFEISLGYTCKYLPYKDGFRQTDIRVNHIAVVESGRAGRHVCIKDKALIDKKRGSIPMNKKQALAAMFSAFAKDASQDDLLAVLPYVAEDDVKTADADKTDKGLLALLTGVLSRDAKPTQDAAKADALTAEAVAKIVKDEVAKALKEAKDAEPKPTKKTAKDELEKMLADEDPDEDEKEAKDEDPDEDITEDEDGDDDKDDKEAKDALFHNVVKAIKPIYKDMSPKEQKQMRDHLQKARKKSTADAYAAILNAVKSNKRALDSAAVPIFDKTSREVMSERNPHYKKA